jgi:zinc transport system substrate-binding protein
VIITLLLIGLSSCAKVKNDKLTIAVSIHPYELMVKQIVKDKGEVVTLIPGNASPHTYNPLPSDIETLDKARLIVVNGLELETSYQKIFKEQEKKLVTLSDFIPHEFILKDEHHHHDSEAGHEEEHHHEESEAGHEEEHEHSAGNPHIWLHTEMIIDMAKGFTQRISQLDPANKKYYEGNLEELINELMETDKMINAERSGLKDINIISFHSSFDYFNARYNIISSGYVQRYPGKEPTPRELKEMTDMIRKNKINLIITEPQLNPKPVEIIAKEFKLKVVKLDPLGGSLKINKISDLIYENWKMIKAGLSD